MTVEGKITRISGPIVFAEGLDECGLYDVVDVGEKKLIGEIIRQNTGKATVQVYEDDTGMRVGEKIVSYGTARHKKDLALRCRKNFRRKNDRRGFSDRAGSPARHGAGNAVRFAYDYGAALYPRARA